MLLGYPFLLAMVAAAGHIHGLQWSRPGRLNQELPESVDIFTLNTTSSPFGTPLTGSYIRLNMNDTNLELLARGLE